MSFMMSRVALARFQMKLTLMIPWKAIVSTLNKNITRTYSELNTFLKAIVVLLSSKYRMKAPGRT